MRVLIGTLMQQGQVYGTFHQSVIEVFQTAERHRQNVANEIVRQIPNFTLENPEHQAIFQANMAKNTIEIGQYTLGGESLLGRGRNHMAQVALTQGWDKLFFIDADEGFTWNDFASIALSEHKVAAGLVPLKAFPVPNSYETVLNYLPFLDDEPFFDDSIRNLKSTKRLARAKKSPWIEVAYTGTGYLCVDVSVFAKLAETADEYTYPNPQTGVPSVHWSFFDGGPMYGQYLSEDWTFCEKARKAGFKIMVNTDVFVTHTGPHTFRA